MSKLANMSEYLRKARVLARKFPTAESIKLHRGQCTRLLEKVMETLDLAEEEGRSLRHPALYTKVFCELYRMVLRVKTFQDECCYKKESDFVIAAIKVSAHRERFIKYHVELDWCIFLIECVRDAKGAPVTSEKYEGFEWKEKVTLLVEDTRSIVENDFSDFKDVLRKHFRKPGDHQKICATLLLRFKEETDPEVDDDTLGVPPFGKKGERIGKGGYGEVYNFKWRKLKFAIKIPSASFGTLDKEVSILEKCCHPNVVNLILFHKNRDEQPVLMMEKLSMNLLEYIAKGPPVPLLEAVDMILQVGEGMDYLSTHRVVHRDLKPQNILVKVSRQDGSVLELQVADFGLAKERAIEESSKHTPNAGTTRYRAPEMTREPGFDEGRIRAESLKADIFSFAVTCSCILTGREPYEEKIHAVEKEELRKFVKKGGRPSLPADCPAELTSLLEDCWHPEPSKRPASFFEICEKLRKLKAMLLTSTDISGDVEEGNQAGTSSPESDVITSQHEPRPPGVPELRVFVLGPKPEAVERFCKSFGIDSGQPLRDLPFKESVSASPPIRLYRVAKRSDCTNYAKIMRSVEVRSERWRLDKLQTAWREDIYGRSRNTTPFPDRSSRFHLVWYICESPDDLPNALQWDDITRKQNGVPVQILVTETNEYERILFYRWRFFDDSPRVEDLIVKVDIRDAEAKNRLWRTCWEVKSRAEIKNAATIIGYIRERLGSKGFLLPGYTGKPKKFSVDQSKDFILNFLCSYWDVPRSFVEVLPSMKNPQEAIKFVPFCLQDAATILYREREQIHGLVPAEASAEFVRREAQACADTYFTNWDFEACDKMNPGDIQGFLEAVFENRDVPQPLVRGLDRSWSFSKFIERLLSKGRGP